jgi:hypothetical protein
MLDRDVREKQRVARGLEHGVARNQRGQKGECGERLPALGGSDALQGS